MVIRGVARAVRGSPVVESVVYPVGVVQRGHCHWCGVVIPVRLGRVPKFCSGACRQRAYRARKRAERAAVPTLPARMTRVRRWVRAAGKRPITVSGAPASSTDPRTWSTYSEVRKSNAGNGFGVMLDGTGLGCVDIDNCLKGDKLEGWAHGVLMNVKGPVVFVERSVSGRGVHVFVNMESRPGRRFAGYEVYSRDRFIRVTLDSNLPPKVFNLLGLAGSLSHSRLIDWVPVNV